MVTNPLLGNARGITWFRRPSGFVAILALLSVVALPRPKTSVVVANDNDRGTAKAASVLDSVSRTIGKEPKYSHKPKYSLVVLGTNADAKLWMVEDGETLYLDKNLNGDLTDDGPPIARAQSQDLCDYKCRELAPVKGPKHTDFCLRRWNLGRQPDQLGTCCGADIAAEVPEADPSRRLIVAIEFALYFLTRYFDFFFAASMVFCIRLSVTGFRILFKPAKIGPINKRPTSNTPTTTSRCVSVRVG